MQRRLRRSKHGPFELPHGLLATAHGPHEKHALGFNPQFLLQNGGSLQSSREQGRQWSFLAAREPAVASHEQQRLRFLAKAPELTDPPFGARGPQLSNGA